MEILTRGLEKWNIALTDRQISQFERYYELLIQKNEVMNLTAITDRAEVQEKHFLDSLALTQAVSLSGRETVIDVGTGAGFPGIPLKILFPEMKIVLADALQKRIGFLQEVIETLELADITTVHGRAEDLGHDPLYREQFDLCVSRAVAPLNILSEYCLPFVKTGGIFAAYKAAAAKEELQEAEHALEVLAGGEAQIKELNVGPSGLNRSFAVIKKTGVTPEKYPRAAGKVKKKPL